MPDRIEAGTYLIAGALTNGQLCIKNINPKIILTEINILKKKGVEIKIKNSDLIVYRKKNLRSLNIKTAPYPGFPTDLQAQIMVLLCIAKGRSSITEEIFENRFMHAPELNRMGAKIKIKGNKAYIDGNINYRDGSKPNDWPIRYMFQEARLITCLTFKEILDIVTDQSEASKNLGIELIK